MIENSDNRWMVVAYIGSFVILLFYFIFSGMYHAGMGPTHVQGFLSALEVPSPSAAVLKRREREMLSSIQNVAQQTCNEAIAEEKRLSTDNDGKVSGHIKYDMGWQKRGSG